MKMPTTWSAVSPSRMEVKYAATLSTCSGTLPMSSRV